MWHSDRGLTRGGVAASLRQIVLASFTGPDAFRRAVSVAHGTTRVAVPTSARSPAARPVVVEVSWPGLSNAYFVRATTGLGDDRQLRTTVHADDGRIVRGLLAIAGGRAIEPVRRHKRYLVRIPARWRRFGGTVNLGGVVEDVSVGGLLLASPRAGLAVGELVAVRLWPSVPDHDLVVTGEVRHVTAGRAGISFSFRDGLEQTRLRTMLRYFEASGILYVNDDATPPDRRPWRLRCLLDAIDRLSVEGT